MDYEKVVEGITKFFDGEYFCIGGVVDKADICGDSQDEYPDFFDEIYVDQDGGGMDGDDFHGTVFFHLGNGRYATADY